ncbi:MAG: bifunctional hydroxymethylpyrimidine kinase/phosphomethylpyrimidine kinase [Hyphomicrobium sp.]|nr:bifunctional hydroxymethylpyrimidine kinase/phosphomethylpyrimidine kinase [Hyphomicrobium sp.]
MARVLALSSHVAFGSVGLAIIVPALHCLGHEAMAVPTVVLSNHPGYARFAGDAVLPGQMATMLDALEANGWLTDTAAIITGYLPTPAHVREAQSTVERVRRANARAIYLCDPVFGDESEGFYLSESTAAAIRDELWPLATIATPNRFELSWLAGLPVGNPHEARRAAASLGVPTVLATSIPAGEAQLANVLVSGPEATACLVHRRDRAPHGTGDLLSALYLGHVLNGEAPPTALALAAAGVEASVAASGGRDELPLAAAGVLWANTLALPTTSV